jgi:hypothetical protein
MTQDTEKPSFVLTCGAGWPQHSVPRLTQVAESTWLNSLGDSHTLSALRIPAAQLSGSALQSLNASIQE